MTSLCPSGRGTEPERHVEDALSGEGRKRAKGDEVAFPRPGPKLREHPRGDQFAVVEQAPARNKMAQ
jgi:hypothetical protein